MKKLLAVLVAPTVLSVTLAVDAFGQTKPSTQSPAPAERSDRMDKSDRAGSKARAAWTNSEGLHESSDIIGTRIKNSQGKDIGEVDKLMIDPKTGQISHVVVGVGGFAGVGEKKVVVPWSDIKFGTQHDGKKAVITMDPTVLDNAPRYERRAATVDRDRMPAASPRSERKSDMDKDKAEQKDKKY
jgi:sporulation protein YlmC with PRC-barrel domain